MLTWLAEERRKVDFVTIVRCLVGDAGMNGEGKKWEDEDLSTLERAGIKGRSMAEKVGGGSLLSIVL